MTTSGGGMLLTDDERLAEHVRKLSTQAREPVAHYEHTEIGYNYRLSNILAALGRAQLSRLDEMMKRRREWRERYRACSPTSDGVRILGGGDDAEDNCWLTADRRRPGRVGVVTRERPARPPSWQAEHRDPPLWKPMHLQPVSPGCGGTLDGTSERLFAHGLTLPTGSAMTDEQFARIEAVIAQAVAAPCEGRAYDPLKRAIDLWSLSAWRWSRSAPVQAVLAVAGASSARLPGALPPAAARARTRRSSSWSSSGPCSSPTPSGAWSRTRTG